MARALPQAEASSENVKHLTLLLVGSLVVLSTALIAPALPAIHNHFQSDPSATVLVPMLVTTPALMITLCAPVAGLVFDRCDTRAVMLAALAGYAIFGAGTALGDNLAWLMLGRAGLGLSVAFVMVGAPLLVAERVPADARAAFFGRQVVVNGVVSLTMTIAGGLLTEWHWRGVFLIYLLALPVAFALWSAAAHTANADHSAADRPPLEPIRWRQLIAIWALALVCMTAVFMVPTRTPFLLADRYGASAGWIAGAMAAFTTGMLPAGLVFRPLQAVGRGPLFGLGMSLTALGLLLQGLATQWSVLIGGLTTTGFGLGLVLANLNATLIVIAPPHQIGRASGGLSAAIFAGQFLSPVVSQPLVSAFGLPAAFVVMGVVVGVVALSCLMPRWRSPSMPVP